MASLRFRITIINLLILWLCCSLCFAEEVDPQESLAEVADELKSAYDKLPTVGKFATGFAGAFVSTRIVVQSAVGAAKVVGATYVASEVLNYSGAFDKLSEESRDKIDDVKKGALKMVNKYRSQIRRRLKPEGIRNAIQAAATKEKAAAAGAATGVFLGLTM